MIYNWDNRLQPQEVAFNKRGMTQGGPRTISGRNQVIQYDAGFWIATLSRFRLKRNCVKAFRALTGLLEGGANQVLVPVFDKRQAPFPTAGVFSSTSYFSDGEGFTDGTGFAERMIQVELVSDAALRATTLDIDVSSAGDISGGEYFEIGNGRLHIITRVLVDAGNLKTVQIWPPLRDYFFIGTVLNFDNPKCRMKLDGEGSDDLNLEELRYGFPNLSFVEVAEPVSFPDTGSDQMCCLKTQQVFPDAGNIQLYGDSKDIIVVRKTVGGATTVNLPPAASRPGQRPIRIVDGKYDAAANNITIDGDGTETIMGGLTYIIDSNGASIELTPLADGSGWM